MIDKLANWRKSSLRNQIEPLVKQQDNLSRFQEERLIRLDRAYRFWNRLA